MSALACEATVMLYDGSPFYPDANAIFDYASEEKFTFFGTSAKFIDARGRTTFGELQICNKQASFALGHSMGARQALGGILRTARWTNFGRCRANPSELRS